MHFVCDGCGRLEYILIDGYGFGERMLEGVMFRVSVDENGGFLATPILGWHHPYLRTLNREYWENEALCYAKENDIAECPKCGQDVDAQPVKD